MTVRLLLLALLVAPTPLLAQPLPTGDTGIAARYERDDGIGEDPDVLFADDFEGIAGDQLEFGMGWDNVYGTLRVTNDAFGGAQAIEIAHDGPEQSQGAWRDFGSAGVERMFVRYYLKYHPDYPGCHHTGGGILAAAPGVDLASSTGVAPDGSNHYTAFIDEIAPFFGWSPPGNQPPGFMYIYAYHMDQGSNYGDVFMPDGSISPNQRTFTDDPGFEPRENIILERDRWYHFELMVQANTPGAADGRIAFWVDGEVAGDFPNLRLRDEESLVPNVAVISSYTSEHFPNQQFVVDDVVVATSYVGPMASAVIPAGDMGPPTPDMGDTPANNDSSQADAGDDNPRDGGPAETDDGPTSESSGCATTNARPVWAPLAFTTLILAARRRRKQAE